MRDSDSNRPSCEVSRRKFLGLSGSAIVAAGALSAESCASFRPAKSYSVAPPRVLGANDRINFALVGFGMRGKDYISAIKKIENDPAQNAKLTTICEIYDRRKKEMMAAYGLSKCVHEFEEVITSPDVDAVLLAIPDHWHATISMDAMRCGKDVYCEKPMTLHWHEAKQVAAFQKETKRVFAVGAQSASTDKWKQARKFIGDGKTGLIGKLLHFQAGYNRNVPGGDWNYTMFDDCTPETLDWRRWLGPAPVRPFDRERFFRFRKYWDYSGGVATDLLYHQWAHLSVALGFPFPKRVTATGGNYVHFDREVPDTFTIAADYENESSGFLFSTEGNQTETLETIRGEHATLTFDKDTIIATPERPYMDAVAQKAKEIGGAEVVEQESGGKQVIKEIRLKTVKSPDETLAHLENFLHCIRTRETPNLDAQAGYRVMTTIALSIKAYRENKVCLFDPQKERLI